ncbi:MAG: hypothetical protein AAF985_19510 [Bacteroidota bacterium]
MKNRISTLILFVLATQLTFAQVKRAYQDEVFSQTTIIVKQDQASDREVLDEYDLDDIGMDQVIRITTEDIAAVQKPTQNANAPTEVKLAANTTINTKTELVLPSAANKPQVAEVAPEDRRPKARRWSKRPKKEVLQLTKPSSARQQETMEAQSSGIQVEAVNQGKQERSTTLRSSRKVSRNQSANVSSKKKKRKQRKFKKAKRKKFKKKKKYRCYRF